MSYIAGRDCNDCGQYKFAEEFLSSNRNSSGLKPVCKACARVKRRAYVASRGNDIKDYLREWKASRHGKSIAKKHYQNSRANKRALVLLMSARARCRKRGTITYKISAAEHKRLQRVIESGFCEVTGLPFNMNTNKPEWDSPTLDRIKPQMGYVDGNVRVVIFAINAALGFWGEETFERVARSYFEKNNAFR